MKFSNLIMEFKLLVIIVHKKFVGTTHNTSIYFMWDPIRTGRIKEASEDMFKPKMHRATNELI